MAPEAIQTTTQQFAGDQIIEPGHHHSDPQRLGADELAFKNAHNN